MTKVPYQLSNASINRMVRELKEGLQENNNNDNEGQDAPRRAGLRNNRACDYSYRYGFMCLEEMDEQHHAMMHSLKPTCGYLAAFEMIKSQEFHYVNFLHGDVNNQQVEDTEIDALIPKVAHQVMLQLAT